MIYVIPITPEDVTQEFIDNLRTMDKFEIRAMTEDSDLIKGVLKAVNTSEEVYGVYLDDELVAVGGFNKFLYQYNPWVICTPKIYKIIKEFTSIAKHLLGRIKGPLMNYVSTVNSGSINWLKSLGFTVDTSKLHEFGGVCFFEFSKES